MKTREIKNLLRIGNTEHIVYGIYQFIKPKFKSKLGRRFKFRFSGTNSNYFVQVEI